MRCARCYKEILPGDVFMQNLFDEDVICIDCYLHSDTESLLDFIETTECKETGYCACDNLDDCDLEEW